MAQRAYMRITGKEGPTQVLVGLIKEFQYEDKYTEKAMQGHPKKGRVYRILKDKIPGAADQFLYRVHVGQENNGNKLDGIMLGDSLQGNHFGRWQYDIVELTPENYLDYDIEQEDLKSITQWFETNNEDLTKLLEGDILTVDTAEAEDVPQLREMELPQEYSLPQELKELLEQSQSYGEILTNLSKNISKLANGNESKMLSIAEMIDDLSTYNNSFPENFIINSSTDESFISSVLSTITLGPQENKTNIFQIIRYCLAELQRLNNNGQEA